MALQTRVAPSVEQKLAWLGQSAAYDLSCACGPSQPRTRGVDNRWIYPAAMPSGELKPMLKVLQHGGCERGCSYCAQRQGGVQGDPLSFTPDELARLFMELYGQERVFGLFLSSAIRNGPVATMDRMLSTSELLRRRYGFRGYLHLKIVPGSQPDQVERAMSLATRVSVNIEAPGAEHLSRVAPSKQYETQILAPMRQIARAQAEGRYRRSGQTTQFVVGATGETDEEIGRTTSWLYEELAMARVYYSGFQPVEGTPLQGRSPAPFIREHRLYQMDFLLRSYGFSLDEIPFSGEGQLPQDTDPKTRWAQLHPERFPVEINTADLEELLRVPGIGPRSARRIIQMRRQDPLRDARALKVSGALWRRAAPYLLLNGRMPAHQLDLFG